MRPPAPDFSPDSWQALVGGMSAGKPLDISGVTLISALKALLVQLFVMS